MYRKKKKKKEEKEKPEKDIKKGASKTSQKTRREWYLRIQVNYFKKNWAGVSGAIEWLSETRTES